VKKTCLAAVFIFIFTLMFIYSSLAQTDNDEFQQALREYQQSSSYSTAEKVIKLTAAMKKLPPIPEEARKHFVRGSVLFKDAKNSDDFVQVKDEFKEAARIAPWWQDVYFNYALACEAAGKYDDAVRNLRLYMLFNLSDTEARTAQDKIYGIEARQEKAKQVAEKTQDEKRAKKIREQEDFLRKINGARYVYYFWGNRSDTGAETQYIITFDVRGDTIIQGQGLADGRDWFETGLTYKIDGRKLHCFVRGEAIPKGDAVIAEDGSSITAGDTFYKRLH